MSINLTPEQEEQVEEIKVVLIDRIAGGDIILDLIDENEIALNEEDEVYELYEDNAQDIRDRYETERQNINGIHRSDDIVQGDLNSWLSHSGRLHGNDNTLLIQEPIRIDAFDFPPAPIQDAEYELSLIEREDHIKAIVQAIALGGNVTDMGLFDDVDSTSFSFRISPNSGYISGDYGVLDSGTDFGIFKVVSVTPIPFSPEVVYDMGPPEVLASPEIPASDLLQVQWIDDIPLLAGIMPLINYSLKPQGTILGNPTAPPQVVKGGVSFGNTERSNKFHPRTNFSFQNFLNYMRASWNYRLYYAQNQLMEYNANLHDFLDVDYKIDKLEPFIASLNQLISDDLFTDAVLNPFWTILINRTTEANDRITEITNQLEGDVYDKFYQFHVFRLNKVAGPFYKADKLDLTRTMIEEQQARDTLALGSI